jgi:hypothetical protein
MTNPFTKIDVLIDYTNGHKIQWALTPFFNAPAPYKFTVLAYQDVGFKEPVYTIDAGESFWALDDRNVRQNVLDSFLYKVQLVDGNGEKYLSGFTDWNPNIPVIRHRYLIASEIVRKEYVRLNAGVGEFGFLIKRRYYSPASLGEVDVVTGEPILDSSKGSYGVGQKNGYYDPVLFKFSVEGKDSNLDLQPEGQGTSYQEVVSIRTAGFPYIESHDIVVTRDGKCYLVAKSDQTAYPGTSINIIQVLKLQIIPPTDTVYKINVPEFPDPNQ